ncbi:MAG: hypothetical protein H6713_40590 [Myxococcales bacterium]|nr:hypothetical protein [Myxococcales bacterium]
MFTKLLEIAFGVALVRTNRRELGLFATLDPDELPPEGNAKTAAVDDAESWAWVEGLCEDLNEREAVHLFSVLATSH